MTQAIQYFDDETQPFFDSALEKVAPGLTLEQRNGVMGLLQHCFGHPWADDELKACMISNIAGEHDLEIPEKWDFDASLGDDNE